MKPKIIHKLYGKAFSKATRVKTKYVINKILNPEKENESYSPIQDLSQLTEKELEHYQFTRERFQQYDPSRITKFGSYFLDHTYLRKNDMIVYSFGIFLDYRFELSLAIKYRCQVHLFDPDPRDLTFYEQHYSDYPYFTFSPIGVWKEDAVLRFNRPPTGGSASAVIDYQNSDKIFEAKVISLKNIMKERNHHEISVLKMDIEGAAPIVMRHMLEEQIYPTQIAMEWEKKDRNDQGNHRAFYEEVDSLCSEFEKVGYTIFLLPREQYFGGIELLFVRDYQ